VKADWASPGQQKDVAAGLVHKAVEFDRFKICVVQLFPEAEEIDSRVPS